jgi:N-methylhydantoinase A/oxoprolinase/acetone carboxylase beta subunit
MQMQHHIMNCVLGIDVGGTNTDAVILQNESVVAWHKTPTTDDIQAGVECAIEEVLKKAGIPPNGHVDSVKIGTTVSACFIITSIF